MIPRTPRFSGLRRFGPGETARPPADVAPLSGRAIEKTERLLLVLFLSILVAGCLGRPSPTPVPAPSPAISVIPTPTPAPARPPLAWDDLSPYEKAMLPKFVGDVAWVERNLHPTHYQMDMTLDWPYKIAGREWVRYTNNEKVPLNEVYFRLFPNSPGWQDSKSEVAKVTVDGKEAAFSLEQGGTALRVPLERPLSPGHSVVIVLDFSASIPQHGGGNYSVFGYKDGVLSLAHFYPMIPVYDEQGWHTEIAPSYGDLTYSDTSLYYIRLRTSEPDLILAASGDILEDAVSSDGTESWEIASGPMRDINLVLSHEFRTATKEVGGVLVTSYYLREDEAGGKRVLRYASDALADYVRRFGPYPFAELDAVETGTTAGGVEYPGMVVISDQFYQEEGGFLEFATAHEVGHQWWYSLVGNDQVNHPWLDEALTNYSAYIYTQDVHGQEYADMVYEAFFKKVYERAEQSKDESIGLPVASYSPSTYGAIVYGKGAMFFDALRREVGDEVFFAILRTYFREYRYRIAAPKDFLEVAEKVSGKNLKSLFQQWGAK